MFVPGIKSAPSNDDTPEHICDESLLLTWLYCSHIGTQVVESNNVGCVWGGGGGEWGRGMGESCRTYGVKGEVASPWTARSTP